MAKKSSAAARRKPPKALHLKGKHKASFIARARQQYAKLTARQLQPHS